MTATNRIYGFTGEHAFLSNFAEHNGTTVEAIFQAAKTHDPYWKDIILAAPTPAKAKYHGRSCPLRPDWEQVKETVMRDALFEKFSIPEFRDALLATGGAELVEANSWGDTYWGVSRATGTGQNRLGVLLMEVRDAIRNGAVPAQVVAAAIARAFNVDFGALPEYEKTAYRDAAAAVAELYGPRVAS